MPPTLAQAIYASNLSKKIGVPVEDVLRYQARAQDDMDERMVGPAWPGWMSLFTLPHRPILAERANFEAARRRTHRYRGETRVQDTCGESFLEVHVLTGGGPPSAMTEGPYITPAGVEAYRTLEEIEATGGFDTIDSDVYYEIEDDLRREEIKSALGSLRYPNNKDAVSRVNDWLNEHDYQQEALQLVNQREFYADHEWIKRAAKAVGLKKPARTA